MQQHAHTPPGRPASPFPSAFPGRPAARRAPSGASPWDALAEIAADVAVSRKGAGHAEAVRRALDEMYEVVDRQTFPGATPEELAAIRAGCDKLGRRLGTVEEALDYLTAGKAKVVLESTITGKEITLAVSRMKEGPLLSVSRRRANGTGYDYLCVVDHLGATPRVTLGSTLNEASPEFRAFRHVWDSLAAGAMPTKATIRYADWCGRCGRSFAPGKRKTELEPSQTERGFCAGCSEARAEERRCEAA